ncbi:MAG: Ig-like domain-containing protein [bacterium]|nr:Ig-like domain-containing protein [bacterium]
MRLLAVICTVGIIVIIPIEWIDAAVKSDETTTLRIISTTDLHGQVGDINYNSASEHNKGSLAQVYTLIKEARNSLKYGNTMTVDVGDTIYGYGSDCINNGTIDSIEYMYTQMATLGYDAMTLGNHDFDYGYEYVKDALEEAGLDNKVVVSNVYDAKTRKNIWAENMVITKKLPTSAGRNVSVKIGLIGVTTPSLTTHYDHTALLVTKDMVESVEEQVVKLKAKNVDLIVVLAHTGIGVQEPDLMSQNVAYAISKINGVDAIIGGHAHVNFPSKDADVQAYYDYPGVTSSGLLNGKVYVAVADRGAGIGIADMKLTVANGKVTVAGKSGKIKLVKTSTPADEKMIKLNESFETQLEKVYNTSLGEIDKRVNNYFGMLEDNIAVQAANEAKIRYGMEFVNQTTSEYKGCKVIAATEYKLVGKQSGIDYIDMDSKFTIGDSLNVQSWNREFAFIYSINGAQIREWLEWQASAYQNPNDTAACTWSDKKVAAYVQEQNLSPVLNPEWLDDWSEFLVFDGIEYEIDPTQPAKYNRAGKVINKKASRVSSLTCNGKEVSDSEEFILVSKRMTNSFSVVGEEVTEQILSNNRVYINQLLQDYVRDQSKNGKLNVEADNNWSIAFPEATNYLIKSSSNSIDIAPAKDWYVQRLTNNSKYAYYQASLGGDVKDTSAPILVLAVCNKKQTGHAIPIAVQASDSSGVKTIKYYEGVIPVDSDLWNGASNVIGSRFEVRSNGIYSVMAEDAYGNRSVKYVEVNNYNSQVLEIPEITKCSNRAKQILGTAEPGAQVCAKYDGEIYSAIADQTGAFAITTPMLSADRLVTIWAKDSVGHESAQVKWTVKRTGANLPLVDNLTNKMSCITGEINDSKYCKVIAVAGDYVYVPENGGHEAYENSSIFDPDKIVVPVTYYVSDGTYQLNIPVLLGNTKIKVYSLDWIDRPSVVTNIVAEEVAPNLPIPYEVYAIDNCVYGKIPKPGQASCTVMVDDGESVYEAVANANGFFTVEVGELTEGQTLTVTASDVVGGVTRVSARAKLTVANYKKGLTVGSDISFESITNKDTLIKGHMNDYSGKINLLIGTKRVITVVDENGDFSYAMQSPKSVGTPIVAMVRDTDGSVWDMKETAVVLAIPDEPELVDETVYDTTTELQLFCADRATAVVKVGSKYYKVDEAVFDEEQGGFVYTITLKEPPKADTKVIYFMMNDAGKSNKKKVVVEVDPDKPDEEDEKTAKQ